jgi:copper chaperone CopZ
MMKTTIQVVGLNNEQKVQQADRALRDVWGILSVEEINVPRSEVTFTYDEKAAQLQDFYQALQESGFKTNGGMEHGAGM